METSQISSSEEQMKSYYESLSEKDLRRYAAMEANKRGYGGSDRSVDYWDATTERFGTE